MENLVVKSGRSKSLLRRHPWVFSGALTAPARCAAGSIVNVVDDQGKFLGLGFANPKSQIVVRILSWSPGVEINAGWFQTQITKAWRHRASAWTNATSALRVVAAEADGLPGLIVDRYGEYLVLQITTAGMEQRRELIIAALEEVFKPRGIYERSDESVRELEGLSQHTGLCSGELPASGIVEVREMGTRFAVNMISGHKTGHYCDQRENRDLVGKLAAGKSVLDAFCNSGGFSLSALRHGASSVTAIDSSRPALAQFAEHLVLNQIQDQAPVEAVCGEVAKVLRQYVQEGRQFDIVVLDPPKFAKNAAQVTRAARAYKDINLLAAKLIKPEGYLASFSCSGHISPELFGKIVFGALNDAGRDGIICKHLFQAADHPQRLSLPESLYLKGLLLKLD